MRAPSDRAPRAPSCFLEDCLMNFLSGQSIQDVFFPPIQRASAFHLFN